MITCSAEVCGEPLLQSVYFFGVILIGLFILQLNGICILNCVILNFGADISSGRFIDILYHHLICSMLSLKL